MTVNTEIDELDRQILRILTEDSKIGYTNIAKMLKKSHITIKKRIEQLESSGIIKRWGVEIDYEKLGYDIIAVIEISISKGKLLEVEKELSKHPNVFAVYDMTGQYDAMIMVRFRTRKELSNIIKDMLRSEYIIRTNTHLVLNVIKEQSHFFEMQPENNNSATQSSENENEGEDTSDERGNDDDEVSDVFLAGRIEK